MVNNSEALGLVPVPVETVELPQGVEGLEATYGQERVLKGYSAVVVADTLSEKNAEAPVDEGRRLVTVIAHFPRCILSEINTHRVFSRNSASSRARSFKSTFKEVMEDPYIPLFTVNRKGMSGDFAGFEDSKIARREWLVARDEAVVSALRLLLGENVELGDALDHWSDYIDLYYEKVYNSDEPLQGAPSIHKQNVNRLLEPFMWHEAIITSSMWENFFDLRVADNAQPEIFAISHLIKTAIEESTPTVSDLHLPLVKRENLPDPNDFEAILKAMTESAGSAAQISYKKVGKEGRKSEVDSENLGKRLLEDRHMSPFEHQAISPELLGRHLEDISQYSVSNLGEEWVQYRKILES